MSAAPFTFYAEAPPRPRRSLLTEARNGNPEAFAEMVSPYLPTLYRRARGLTGNTADAQDVSQEAVLKAWSRLEQFTGKQDESIDDFRAWISRIAANTSIDLLRQRRDGKIASLDQRKGESEETLGSGIASEQLDPEERCARRELGRLLAKAIAQLPPDLRPAGHLGGSRAAEAVPCASPAARKTSGLTDSRGAPISASRAPGISAANAT